MTFADLAAGTKVFVDANVLIDYFAANPARGPACKALVQRIENREIKGYTAAHVIAEMAHRLMTIEAAGLFGWPQQGLASRLNSQPSKIQQLGLYRRAIDEIPLMHLGVFGISRRLLSLAVDCCRQFGLLCNDGLIVAVMRDKRLFHLASNDPDFDRVPGLTRYAPV